MENNPEEKVESIPSVLEEKEQKVELVPDQKEQKLRSDEITADDLKIIYNAETDAEALQKVIIAKRILFVFLGRMFGVLAPILVLVGGVMTISILFGPIGVAVSTIVGTFIVVLVILTFLIAYVPGSIIAIVMTLFDPSLSLLESESLTSTMTKVLTNGAMSWYYVEKTITGKAKYSEMFLT